MKVAIIGPGEGAAAAQQVVARLKANGEDVIVAGSVNELAELTGFKSDPVQQHVKLVARYQEIARMSSKPSRRERRAAERKSKKKRS